MEKDYVERKRARRERGRKRDWERERETMEKERGRERLGEGERDYGERERRRDREYGEREILREGERGDGGERERERGREVLPEFRHSWIVSLPWPPCDLWICNFSPLRNEKNSVKKNPISYFLNRI